MDSKTDNKPTEKVIIGDVAILTAKVQVLEESVVSLTKENEELKVKLEAKPEAAVSSANEGTIITMSKKRYRVNHGVIFEGKKYTMEELAKDKPILAKLAEFGSTAVTAL